VAQLKVTVVPSPAARPPTLCVPIVTPSVASTRVTTKAPAAWLPTFCTVTLTPAVSPWSTDATVLTLVTLTSVTGAGPAGDWTVTTLDAWSLAGLSSGKSWLPVSVWSPIEALALFQLMVTIVWAPTARLATLLVPMVTPSVSSTRVTVKAPTGWLPRFFNVTFTPAMFPCVSGELALTLVTAMSVTGAGPAGSVTATVVER